MRVSILALIVPTVVYAVAIDKDNVDEVNGEGLVGYFKNMWLSKRDILYRYHNNHDSWNDGSWRDWRDGSWRDGNSRGSPYPEAPVFSDEIASVSYQPFSSTYQDYSSPVPAVAPSSAAVTKPASQVPVSYSVQIENGNYVYRPVYASSSSVNDEYSSESFSEPNLALFPTDSPFAKHYPEFQEPEGLF